MSTDSIHAIFRNPNMERPCSIAEELLKEHEIFFANTIRSIHELGAKKASHEKVFTPRNTSVAILLGTVFYGAGNACGRGLHLLLLKCVVTEPLRIMMVHVSSVASGILGLSLCIYCLLGRKKFTKEEDENLLFDKIIKGIYLRRDEVNAKISAATDKLVNVRSFAASIPLYKEKRELQQILDNLLKIERLMLQEPQ